MVFSRNFRIGLPFLIKLGFQSSNKNKSSKISFIPAQVREPGTFTRRVTSLTLSNHVEMSKKTRHKEDTRLLLQIADYASGKKKWNCFSVAGCSKQHIVNTRYYCV